ETQKRWYDRNAREKTLEPGDKVLVLLPTSSNKLLAQWQGPYTVEKRVSDVTYQVDMSNKRKRHRVFHKRRKMRYQFGEKTTPVYNGTCHPIWMKCRKEVFMDELIDRLGSANYISTLDLSRGYWQVPMSAQSRAKTAFVTSYGLFEFNVMPFGLQGAPSTFQRMMDQLLRGLEDCAAAYLDDLVIHNATWPEHLASLRKVLERLRTAGLTAKPSKCHFAMKECTYLGHIVGNGQVRPEIGKLTAVEDFPVPKTKKEVRTFLGLTGYYRKFVPCYASLAAPLTELTRSNAPTIVKWTTSCNTAFMDLKRLLCSSPVLQCPDFSRPFILQTDASDWGVGGVLSQLDQEGLDHPVAYFS
ncbi:hypothetical protein EMCRGX_G003566, partial [Ephydatia muelleri]